MKTVLLSLVFLSVTTAGAQSLNDYLLIAADSNSGLKAKYAEFEAALHKVEQVKSLPDPTFSVSAFGRMIETRVGPQQGIFILSQSFPWFGTLKAQGNVMAFMAEAQFQQWLDARNELFYNVKSVWYQLYEVERTRRYQLENRRLLETYKTLALTKLSVGSASMMDVLRVDLMLDENNTKLKILEEKEQSFLVRFNALLNRELSASVNFPDTLSIVAMNGILPMDSMLVVNPLIVALDKKSESWEEQQRLAKKQGMPKLGLGINYTLIGERIDMKVADNGQDAIMPMFSISLPIYRKKYQGVRDEAASMLMATTMSRRQLENELLATYAMANFELNKAKSELELSQLQVKKTNQIMELLLIDYTNDKTNMETLLATQQLSLSYKTATAIAIKNYFVAAATMDYLTAKND